MLFMPLKRAPLSYRWTKYLSFHFLMAVQLMRSFFPSPLMSTKSGGSPVFQGRSLILVLRLLRGPLSVFFLVFFPPLPLQVTSALFFSQDDYVVRVPFLFSTENAMRPRSTPAFQGRPGRPFFFLYQFTTVRWSRVDLVRSHFRRTQSPQRVDADPSALFLFFFFSISRLLFFCSFRRDG